MSLKPYSEIFHNAAIPNMAMQGWKTPFDWTRVAITLYSQFLFPERLWDGLYSIEKRLPECLLLFIFDLQPCVCGWIEDEGLGMCLADDGVEKWIVVSLSFKCTYSPAPALGSSWGMQPCLTLKAVTGGILLFSRDSVIFRMKIHSCLTSARVLPRCLIFFCSKQIFNT